MLLGAFVGLAFGDRNECDLLQVVTDMGVGLYAGRAYAADEIIEQSLGIPVPSSVHRSNILDNYVEGYPLADWNLVTLGYAMVYNHGPAPFHMLSKYMDDSIVESISHLDISEEHSSTVVTYFANRNISRGDQILNNYGETWFVGPSRPVEVNPCADTSDRRCHVDIASAVVLPGCPMKFTTLSKAKLYARQIIRAGTIIEVSRALVLPVAQMSGSRGLQSLLWYFAKSSGDADEELAFQLLKRGVRLTYTNFAATMESQSSAEISNDGELTTTAIPLIGNNALLLLGYGSFFSPSEDANVVFSRFRLEGEEISSCKEKSAMLVSFTATRDIPAGELLTVNIQQVPVQSDRNEISEEANWRRLVHHASFAQECDL